MRKYTLFTFASILLVGCGSEGGQGLNSSSFPEIGQASGAVSLPRDIIGIELESSTQYEWSVRARTALGDGEWSTGLEFSIHNSEALALADAVAKEDDSYDFDPSLQSDQLPVPTVVSQSPVGSILDHQPTFTWVPVPDAIEYEVRVLDVGRDSEVFINSFVANEVCRVEICHVDTVEESTVSSTASIGAPIIVDLDTQTIAFGSTEANPNLGVAPAELEPEIVSFPIDELLPVDEEIQSIDAALEPEVIQTPETAQTPQVAQPPVIVQIPEETQAPEVPEVVQVTEGQQPQLVSPVSESTQLGEASLAETTQGVGIANSSATVTESGPFPSSAGITNFAVNSEIETLQRAEGVLAFPGALGYAKNAVGGRGGRVIVVDTLENVVDSSDGVTSFREAIEVESGPRTIVFAVGGIFDTGSTNVNFLGESGSNVTIACQTAPSPGVIIRTFGFNAQNGAHDIIFRHCTVRGIDVGAPNASSGRTITIRGGSRNIILDHMSFSWATDEGFQVYLAPGQNVGIENVTLSNSIIAEGDADSSHHLSQQRPEWRYHAMGPSCNSGSPEFQLSNCSIVNNFIAHNSSRNAMIWGGAGELKNNVIYNWYGIGLTVQPHDGSGVDAIIDNNLMKSGPDSIGATSNPNCGAADYRCAMYLGASNSHGPSRFLIGDNYYIPEFKSFDDVVRIDHWNAESPDGRPPFDSATDSPVHILDMAAEGSRFMSCVGASKPTRDHVDSRVIQEFYDGTGTIGIGENIRTGGHNVYTQRTWDQYPSTAFHPADYDRDQDGMADEWEISYGLSPTNPNDHSGDLDSDGYTNIEEFLALAALCGNE